MNKQKGMSFVEKAGLFFGIVGVFADFAALVSFTYGFASLEQFTPTNITTESATSFFKWFSGLIIIYAWLITSWYFVRRSFVLRYEKPRGYKNPLDSRAQRTIFGIALFLFPTFVYWSIVNISFNPVFTDSNLDLPHGTETLVPTIGISPTSTESPISTPNLIYTESNSTTLTPESARYPSSFTVTETPIPTPTAIPPTLLPRPSSPEDEATFFGVLYYVLGLPIIMWIFGLVIYLCINSLMPIVHVELLDDYE